MTKEEIENYIDEIYPKVEGLILFVGMTKEQWKKEATGNLTPKFERCENCTKHPCQTLENLKEEYPRFIEVWYEHGTTCTDFNPKPDARGEQ